MKLEELPEMQWGSVIEIEKEDVESTISVYYFHGTGKLPTKEVLYVASAIANHRAVGVIDINLKYVKSVKIIKNVESRNLEEVAKYA